MRPAGASFQYTATAPAPKPVPLTKTVVPGSPLVGRSATWAVPWGVGVGDAERGVADGVAVTVGLLVSVGEGVVVGVAV